MTKKSKLAIFLTSILLAFTGATVGLVAATSQNVSNSVNSTIQTSQNEAATRFLDAGKAEKGGRQILKRTIQNQRLEELTYLVGGDAIPQPGPRFSVVMSVKEKDYPYWRLTNSGDRPWFPKHTMETYNISRKWTAKIEGAENFENLESIGYDWGNEWTTGAAALTNGLVRGGSFLGGSFFGGSDVRGPEYEGKKIKTVSDILNYWRKTTASHANYNLRNLQVEDYSQNPDLLAPNETPMWVVDIKFNSINWNVEILNNDPVSPMKIWGYADITVEFLAKEDFKNNDFLPYIFQTNVRSRTSNATTNQVGANSVGAQREIFFTINNDLLLAYEYLNWRREKILELFTVKNNYSTYTSNRLLIFLIEYKITPLNINSVIETLENGAMPTLTINENAKYWDQLIIPGSNTSMPAWLNEKNQYKHQTGEYTFWPHWNPDHNSIYFSEKSNVIDKEVSNYDLLSQIINSVRSGTVSYNLYGLEVEVSFSDLKDFLKLNIPIYDNSSSDYEATQNIIKIKFENFWEKRNDFIETRLTFDHIEGNYFKNNYYPRSQMHFKPLVNRSLNVNK